MWWIKYKVFVLTSKMKFHHKISIALCQPTCENRCKTVVCWHESNIGNNDNKNGDVNWKFTTHFTISIGVMISLWVVCLACCSHAVCSILPLSFQLLLPLPFPLPLLDTFDTCEYFLQVFALLTSLQRVYQLSIIRLHGCCWEISFILVCLPRFFRRSASTFAFALVPC